MRRRNFIIAMFSLPNLLLVESCWITPSIFENINRYIPMALLAFDRVLDILIERGYPLYDAADKINLVKAALADIQSAIEGYKTAIEANKNFMIAILESALQMAEIAIIDFWHHLEIMNPVLAHTIKSLLGVIISTLRSFQEQLPHHIHSVVDPEFRFYPAELRTVSQFREDFNRVLREIGYGKLAI